jgi:hypothetical protein
MYLVEIEVLGAMFHLVKLHSVKYPSIKYNMYLMDPGLCRYL